MVSEPVNDGQKMNQLAKTRREAIEKKLKTKYNTCFYFVLPPFRRVSEVARKT